MAKSKNAQADEAAAPAPDDSTTIIELVQHVGTNVDKDLGEVEVRFDQYIIRVTNAEIRKQRPFLEVGYVGMKPGAPINWLPVGNRFPQDVQKGIEQAVQQKLATMPGAHESDKELAKAGQTRRASRPLSEELMNAPPLAETAAENDTAGSDENL